MKKQCLICRVPDCSLQEEEQILACPIHKFLKVLGGKRGMIVLLVLETPHRFGALKRAIPEITEKMLLATLHDLQQAALINHEKIAGKVPVSTYSISVRGKKALEIAVQMAEIGKQL